MSEDLDPLTIANQPKPIHHRGILIAMAISALIAAAAGFAFGGMRFGIGVLVGGLLAFVNYFWLDNSTKAIFSQQASASAAVLALKYVSRYVFIACVLFLIYLTDAFPVAAVILGLAIFAFAVVFQGLKNIITASF